MRRLVLLIFSIFSISLSYGQLPYSESFETGFGIWVQDTIPVDDFDWTRNSGSTYDPGTGPNAASDGNYYLYIIAHQHHDKAAMIEAPFDFSGTTMPILSFDYNLYGIGVGFLRVWVYDGSAWTEIWNQLSSQGNQWNNVKLCLGTYADNPNVKIRFVADVQSSDSSDIAIDNIKIVDFRYNNVTKTDVSCGGYSDGSIGISIAGGFGSYEYSINDGINYTSDASTSHTFSSLSGGDYPVKVKGISGCVIALDTVVHLSEPTTPNISYSKNDVSPCIESKNGEIDITATGDNSPFTYSITGFSGTFQASNTFSGLDTGNYQIAVKNTNGCIALGSSVAINCPTRIIIADQSATDVSTCYGDCNGSVSVSAGGGNTPLSYALDTSSTLTFENSNTFTGLCVGTYRVIIEDNAGCRDTSAYVTINQPPLLKYTNISHTDISDCFGDTTATISLAATGGTGTINYTINNGTTYQSSGNFYNLGAGDYHSWIRDQNNCLADGGIITILQPAKLVLDSTKYKDVTGCFGNANGEIHIYASGGTSPLNYSINGTSFNSSNDFTSLDVGDYFPFVKDANGCKDSATTITITQPTQLQITKVNVSDVNNCFGDSTGVIQIFADNGTPPYTYSIDNGATFQTLYSFNTVKAGTYQIVVKDDNGCEKYLDSTVTVKQPQQIVITSQTSTNVSCNGTDDGSIFVDANGGTGSLLFSIDNGLTFSDTVGRYAYNIQAGSYQIVVRDDNNCKVNGNLLTITEPDSLLIDSIITKDVDACYGDSTGIITIYAKGGTSPINYSINNGFSFQSSGIFNNLPARTGYLPYVQDKNGCFVLGDQQTIGQPPQLVVNNQSHTDIDTCHGVPVGTISIISNGGTGTIYYSINNGSNFFDNSGNFSNLYAGTYNIKVKDSKNCIADGWQETIFEPDTFLIDSIYTQNLKCNGIDNGEIYIYSSGGQPQINYSINNGITFQTSSQFVGLSPGNYNILIKDKYNCETSSSTSITEPPLLVLDSTISTNVNTCYGDSTGTISIYGHGGVPALEYACSIVGSSPSNFVTTNIFNKIKAGSYYVTLRDQNGCTQTSSSINVTQPSLVQISSYQSTNVTCYGLSDGTISINAIGGTPGYEYSIDDGLNWYKNNGIFTGLDSNSYIISVRDTNNCKVKSSQSLIITTPFQLKFKDIQGYNPECFGYTNGKILSFPAGGTAPYTYTLDDTLTQTSSSFENLPGGQYWVTLKDHNNCVAHSDTLTLVMPENLSLFTTSVDSGCAPLTVKFTPDTNLAIFKWDFGDSTQSAWFSPKHVYYDSSGATINFIATAIAEHGNCTDSTKDTIMVFSQPNVYFDVDYPIHYYPDTNVSFNNISPSLTSYLWDFGDKSNSNAQDPGTHSYPNCGNYNISLIAKNAHSCIDTAYQSVEITGLTPDANFIMDKNEGCEPLTINFTNTSSSAIRYEWIYNNKIFSTDTNPTLNLGESSNYLIKLNAYGYCNKKDSLSKAVYVYPIPKIDFTVSPDTVGTKQDVLFQNNSTGASYYIWDFGDGNFSGEYSPIRSYSSPGTYSITLKGTSVNSCADSLTLDSAVFVSSDFYFKLPNAFSPDGDGVNDLFKPVFNMVRKCRVDIISRSGKLLFRTDDFAHTFWDGTFNGHKMPIDVYIWEINGQYESGKYFHRLGTVTLIR